MRIQAIFNKAVRRCLKQGVQSYCKKTRYHIRTEDGLRDPIGMLILKKHYHTGLENKTVKHPYMRHAIKRSIGRFLEESEEQMLHDLQFIHDCRTPEMWEGEFKGVSKKYNLGWIFL